MTITEHPAMLGCDLVDLATLDDAASLANLLNQADRTRQKPSAGLVWFVQFTADENAPGLILGVRGDMGALQWYDEREILVPAHGSNTTWVDYFTMPGDHHPMPPGSELPIDQVYVALEEFVKTRRRPACVEWKLS